LIAAKKQLDRPSVLRQDRTYSPVTKDHVGPGGMKLADIVSAVSAIDNTSGT